jgi:hypothetical protein
MYGYQLASMLQSITMPIKNFFLSLSLTPTCSSPYYPLLQSTDTSLNCQPQNYHPMSSITLNCRLTQTMHDMPSSHVRLLRHLRHWTYSDMPSSPYIILRHLRQLSYLGHLGNIDDLDTLDPYPLNPTPTDSQLEAFITEPDPMDPGLLEGYYEDDSLDPISTDTPLLLPCLDRHYISQITLNEQPRTFS